MASKNLQRMLSVPVCRPNNTMQEKKYIMLKQAKCHVFFLEKKPNVMLTNILNKEMSHHG